MKKKKDIHVYKPGDVNKIKTTLTLKLGTKHKLSNIANKNESFDDVINRLIRSNEILEQKINEYKSIIGKKDLEKLNRLESTIINRGINSIKLSDNSVIRFTYNKPNNVLDKDYSMDVQIDEIFSDNKYLITLKDIFENKRLKSEVYFRIIEKIINIHFDSSYSIPKKKNIVDPFYWKKVWKRINLSEHSFTYDIKKFITELMEDINE